MCTVRETAHYSLEDFPIASTELRGLSKKKDASYVFATKRFSRDFTSVAAFKALW